MTRRRRRTGEGILKQLWHAPWPVAAGLGLFALVLREGLPLVLSAPLFGPLLVVADGLLSAFAAVCALIALFRLALGRWAQRLQPEAVDSQPANGEYAPPGTGSSRRGTPEARSEFLRRTTLPLPHRPTGWSLDVIQRMEWKRFEELCAAWCRARGMRADTTCLGADGGVDIRLHEDPQDPLRCTGIVQCKAWGERLVGIKPVRELRGVMAHEQVEQGFFMAQGGFTAEARSFARDNKLELIDGDKLLALIQLLPAQDSQSLLRYATTGDWTTPTCPSCDTKMLARVSERGRFWGCTNFPRCRQMLNMRRVGEVECS